MRQVSAVETFLNDVKRVDATRERPQHPRGWEPGIAWKGTEGTVISEPTAERDPEWDHVLQHFKFDPENFEVVEPIEVRSWEGFIKNDRNEIEKTTLWYHRARVIRRRDPETTADVEALIAEVKKHRPAKALPATDDRAFVLNFADWQLGKEGTEQAVERVLAAIDNAAARIRHLRKIGRPASTLYLANMGDMFENTAGHYAMQTFTVELTRVEQLRLGRRLVVKALKMLAPLFEHVVALALPGNHPENRNAAGKAYTTFQDNDDLEVMIQVSEILAENPDTYGHVSFVVPDDELSVTLDIHGTVVCFAHGHQFPRKKHDFAWEWWDGQARGMKPAGDATILVSAHRHCLALQQRGVRTWLQCPTIDSGSTWYENTTGETTSPGTLSFTVDSEGWGDLALL